MARVEIEKFDENGDFALWKAKSRLCLVSKTLIKPFLDPSKLSVTLTTLQREDMKLNVYGTLIRNLSDSVIRQVIEGDAAYKVWKKLKSP